MSRARSLVPNQQSLSNGEQEKLTAMENSIFINGIWYPNKVFIGCLPHDATAFELAAFFGHFGVVLEAKVMFKEDNSPKGYGFVTFANQEAAEAVLRAGVIFYKGKKINVAYAVRKQLTTPMIPSHPNFTPQHNVMPIMNI